MMAFGCYAQQQTDEFTTKSGKKVRFTCIKHASIQINYDGFEIQVDPVGMGMKPPTFLKPGDVVDCEIEGIGVLRNYIEG